MAKSTIIFEDVEDSPPLKITIIDAEGYQSLSPAQRIAHQVMAWLDQEATARGAKVPVTTSTHQEVT